MSKDGSGPQYHGCLVALEGPADTVSVQLRLLPTVPQILILPGLHHYLEPHEEDLESSFNAPSYIGRVHQAAASRHEIALQFLRQSAPDDKRLVFLNGGTACAQALCISAIAEHETDGDIARAESLFSSLIRDGVAGLAHGEIITSRWRDSFNVSKDDGGGNDVLVERLEPTQQHVEEEEVDDADDEPLDPIWRAMKAADALYRETAALQPGDDFDAASRKSRRRSMSLPRLDLSEPFHNDAFLYLFGSDSKSGSVRGRLTSLSSSISSRHPSVSRRSKGSRPDGRPPLPDIPPGGFSKYENQENSSLPSPLNFPASYTSLPCTPEMEVYHEARLAQLRALDSPKTPTSTSKSSKDSPISDRRDLESGKRNSRDSDVLSNSGRRRSASYTATDSPHRRSAYLEVPKGGLSKMTRNQLTSPESPTRLRYRGVDPESLWSLISPKPRTPYEPVLPLLEDISIHFSNEDLESETLLGHVIRCFKDGTYPFPPRSSFETTDIDEKGQVPATPESRASVLGDGNDYTALYLEASREMLSMKSSRSTLDYQLKSWSSQKDLTSSTAPPTPVQRPSSSAVKPAKKFHTCSISSSQPAVCIQNSLRSILNVYFPPEDKGYHQSQYAVLPGMDSLWKPILYLPDSGNGYPTRRKIDIILAIGAQAGVRKGFSSVITCQVEKLATKRSGLSRAGRLDLR
jgi:hypothetical protein